MTRSLLAASALAIAMLAPHAATASEFDYRGKRVVTDTIAIDDLDLSSRWGMDRLIKRVRGRIDDMCGSDADCRDEAWLSADWQVARAAERDLWRQRIDDERNVDWRYYRGGRGAPPPAHYDPRQAGGAPPPMIVDDPGFDAPPLSVPTDRPVAKTTTVTTQTFTVKTTTVTLTYRLPPAGPWRPRCRCE